MDQEELNPCIVASDKQVYEAIEVRADGTLGALAVLECNSDIEAKTLATAYAALWETPVKLVRVPAVNMTGASSWDLWPDEVLLIALIEPPPEGEGKELAAKLRAELHDKFTGTKLINLVVESRGNPHMWIPYHGPRAFDEVCDLCGVFSGAHHKQPDPPEATLPCPEPWPESNLTDEDFAALEAEAERQDRADGNSYLYDQLPSRK
jgi:hypothetical protein